jgi:DNA-binding NarL/FixJ family response regulator
VSHRRPRIVVADAPGLSLNTAISILNDRFDVAAVATNADAAIDATLSLRADVVVLDAALDPSGAFVWAKQLGTAGPYPRIVLVSNDIRDESVLAALERGVAAVVAKPRMALDLAAAVSQVHAGGRFIPSAALLPVWRNRLERRHDLQVYRTDRQLLAAVGSYFATALDAGDSILAIASPSILEELDTYMASRFDPRSLRAVGRYSTLDSAAALAAVCRGGVPDAALWAAALDPLVEAALAASPSARVTAFGQIAPILCERGEFEAMIRLERVADAYTAARPVSILCAYATQCLGDSANELTARIHHEHVTVVPADAPA